MIWEEIASRLQHAFESVRTENQWSWPKLAKETSTTKTTLKNWISGKHFPSRLNWVAIERVTKVSVEEFILGEERAAKVVRLREQLCDTPAEMALLRDFRNCNQAGKDSIARHARFTLQEHPQDANVKQFAPHKKVKS